MDCLNKKTPNWNLRNENVCLKSEDKATINLIPRLHNIWTLHTDCYCNHWRKLFCKAWLIVTMHLCTCSSVLCASHARFAVDHDSLIPYLLHAKLTSTINIPSCQADTNIPHVSHFGKIKIFCVRRGWKSGTTFVCIRPTLWWHHHREDCGKAVVLLSGFRYEFCGLWVPIFL